MAKKRTNRKPAASAAETTSDVVSTSVGLIAAGQPVYPDYSRATAVKQYASWVYAATRINAVGFASIPLRLYTMGSGEARSKGYEPTGYRTRPVPKDRRKFLLGGNERMPHRETCAKMVELGDDFEEVTSHPALDLLSSANPWNTGYEILTKLAIHLQACGDGFWYVENGGIGGTPSLLLPLLPKLVEVIPSKVNFIDGYLYGMRQAEPVALTVDEVIHFRVPDPDSQYYGMGWYKAAWQVINQNNAAHQMDTAFFANYARPDYLVTIEQGGGDGKEQIKRFQEQIKQQNGGVKKTGRALAVTGKVDLKPMNFPPKDLGGRDNVVEEIAAISGVPVTMLKSNDPNLASAEVGYAAWREMTIAPLCKMVEAVLNQFYLRLWGIEGQAVFAFDDPVPKNKERDSIILDREIRSGLRSINEARETLGADEADDPYASRLLFNGQPLGGLGGSLGLPMGGNGGVVQPTDGDVADQPDGEAEADGGTDQATAPAPQPVTQPKPVDPNGANPAAAVASSPGEAVQDTALNGAQVSSLVDLVSQARADTIPVDTAEAIAAASFPLMKPEQIAAIFNPIRSAPPLPKPEPAPTTNQPPMNGAPKESAKSFRQSDYTGHMSGQMSGHCCADTHTKAADLPLDDVSEQRIRSFIASMDTVLQAQATAMVAQLRAQGLSSPDLLRAVMDVLRDPEWISLVREASAPHIGTVLQSGAAAGLEALPGIPGTPPPSFEFTNPEVQRWVDRATTRLAVGMNQTTEVRVSELLGDGLQKGETIDQLSQRVVDATGVNGNRAEMIARTESARGYEAGQREAWRQTGLVTGKRWLLAPDACEFCKTIARASNDNPVPLDQPFAMKGQTVQGVSGGSLLLDYEDVQGAPLHPGCRCTTIPVRGTP